MALPPGFLAAGVKGAVDMGVAIQRPFYDAINGAGAYDRDFLEVNNMAGIPGVDIQLGNIMPGGAPFLTPEPINSGWVYSHTANGVNFYRSMDGKYHGCFKKSGAWKSWRTYKPVVFGKKLDAAKLAKIIKRHAKAYKELKKVFDKGTKRKTVYAGYNSRRDINAPGVEIQR